MQSRSSTATIGLVGAGFSGIALAAALDAATHTPLHLILIEKTGEFGAGDAYRTPYPFHLLNARAEDMSVHEHDPEHFVRWLASSPLAAPYLSPLQPIAQQYLPRFLYRHYLQFVLAQLESAPRGKLTIARCHADIVNMAADGERHALITADGERIIIDHVVFCLGNPPVAAFPFEVGVGVNCIENPWHYTAMTKVQADANVVIVGSGLSMIDAVLTLQHHAHRGNIAVVSRHGLLPLPHAKHPQTLRFEGYVVPDTLPAMMCQVRKMATEFLQQGGDWRMLMNSMRLQFPSLWQTATVHVREQFLRHVLSYWNIHRHRVHASLHQQLITLQMQGRLQCYAARIETIANQQVTLRERVSGHLKIIKADHIVNCMGSGLHWKAKVFPVLDHLLALGLASLDDLKLGLAVDDDYALLMQNGQASTVCFAIGPLIKGVAWETVAAPEIRKQCVKLTETLNRIILKERKHECLSDTLD